MSRAATVPRYSDFGDDLPPLPERTSVLAIMALVFGLLCIIPGSGVAAAIFGISAMVGISAAKGRVTGRGMALTGLALGLITTAIWAAIAIGSVQFYKMLQNNLMKPSAEAIAALDAGDWAKTRQGLLKPVTQNASDEQLRTFRDEYAAELGRFQGVPESFVDMIRAYQSAANELKDLKGSNNIIPVPGVFERGNAIIRIEIDPSAPVQKISDNVSMASVRRVTIRLPSGKVVVLEGLAPGEAPKVERIPPPDPPAPARPSAPPEPR